MAIYFTAGVALSYFPATAAFAAGMPGFAAGGTLGLGVGEGAVAGTGVFSEAAASIGLGGGLAEGSLEAGTTVAQLAGAGYSAAEVPMGYTTLADGTVVQGGTAAAGASSAPTALVSNTPYANGTLNGVTPPPPTAPIVHQAAAQAGSSLTEKLLLASMGAQTLSG